MKPRTRASIAQCVIATNRCRPTRSGPFLSSFFFYILQKVVKVASKHCAHIYPVVITTQRKNVFFIPTQKSAAPGIHGAQAVNNSQWVLGGG